jgi:hypothetical protein
MKPIAITQDLSGLSIAPQVTYLVFQNWCSVDGKENTVVKKMVMYLYVSILTASKRS